MRQPSELLAHQCNSLLCHFHSFFYKFHEILAGIFPHREHKDKSFLHLAQKRGKGLIIHLMVPEHVKFRHLNAILIIYTTTDHSVFQQP